MKTQLAFITVLGGGESPDQGLPGGRPDRPDQGLPGGGLHPWFPGHLPPGGSTLPLPPPVTPDNTLPTPPTGAIISLPIFLPPGETKPVEPAPPTGGTKPPDAGTKPPAGSIDPKVKFELKWTKEYGWVLVVVTATPK